MVEQKATNVHWHHGEVTREDRHQLLGHKGATLWFTGLSGSGKSTVGVLLAKEAELDFVDTDVLIQTTENRSLQDIVDKEGYLALRTVEERVILGLQARHTVIATGGSAVYSEKGVAHLKANGTAVYIDVPLSELERRVHHAASL